MHPRNLIALTCLIGLAHLSAQAQQLPVFTQYREYQSFINPGAVSSDYFTYEYNLSFGASYRRQWLDFNDSPRNMFVRGEYVGKTKGKAHLIAGGYFLRDDTHPISFNGAYGRVGVMLSDDPFLGGLSAGLTVGMVQYRVKAQDIEFLVEDPVVAEVEQLQTSPDIGFGLFYFKQIQGGKLDGDNFYLGASMPQILGFDLNFRNGDKEFNIDRIRHVFFQAGYYKYVSESSYLEPSVWVKYVKNAPVHIDLNLRYHYSNIFWVGTGYATSKAIHFEAGFNVGAKNAGNSNFKIGYGFDYSVGKTLAEFGNSHEINISYSLDTHRR